MTHIKHSLMLPDKQVMLVSLKTKREYAHCRSSVLIVERPRVHFGRLTFHLYPCHAPFELNVFQDASGIRDQDRPLKSQL